MQNLAQETGGKSTLRRGFTLVELLVVITIIAILTALVVPAVINAQKRAQSTRIKAEVDQLAMAFEDYRNDVSGGQYPPNAYPVNANALVRHFKKAFPRHREPEALIRRLAGATISTGQGSGPEVLTGGMNPAEAIFFWLGGFSSDPKYPISGPGGPSFKISTPNPETENIEDRNRVYDFELTRVGTGEGKDIKTALADGISRKLTYTVSVNGDDQTRQINFWQYYPPNSTKPFVYFDTSRGTPTSINETTTYVDLSVAPEVKGVCPIKRRETTISDSATPTLADLRFANEDKFQILHAGIDDDWGGDTDGDGAYFDSMRIDPTQPDVIPLLYPAGPFAAELGDTIVNFDERTLQDAQP